jgi:hypothetical protein
MKVENSPLPEILFVSGLQGRCTHRRRGSLTEKKLLRCDWASCRSNFIFAVRSDVDGYLAVESDARVSLNFAVQVTYSVQRDGQVSVITGNVDIGNALRQPGAAGETSPDV